MDDINLIFTRIETSHSDTLNLSNRRLKVLPILIQKQSQLKFLYLDDNELIFVPEIGELNQLEEISIENNQLTMIPESFCNLKNLRCLNLSKNRISSINSSIFNCLENLTSLWLNNCELMFLPREIGNLKSLEKLGLKFNSIQTIPEELGLLNKLKWLNAEKNELISLPSQFKNLKNLNYLNLSRNKFEQFPTEIPLQNMSILILSNNLIKSLKDDEILNLSVLEKVDLRENPFIKAKEFLQLSNIKNFILK
jgi:Leucine-rich repeat (LRR) protein